MDLYKSLMIYRNTLLSNQLQSPVQILQSCTATTQLPISNMARNGYGLGSEQLRVKSKNKQLPTHDLHIGQSVMYLNAVNRRLYPATITSLYWEPRCYKIRTENGSIYRKTQNHWYCTNDNTRKSKWTTVKHEHWHLILNNFIIVINKIDQNVN